MFYFLKRWGVDSTTRRDGITTRRESTSYRVIACLRHATCNSRQPCSRHIGRWYRIQQGFRVTVPRLCKYISAATLFDDLPAIHHGNLFAVLFDNAQIMGNQ